MEEFYCVCTLNTTFPPQYHMNCTHSTSPMLKPPLAGCRISTPTDRPWWASGRSTYTNGVKVKAKVVRKARMSHAFIQAVHCRQHYQPVQSQLVQGKRVCTSKNICLSMRAAFSLPHLAMCQYAYFIPASQSLSPLVKLPHFCSAYALLLWRLDTVCTSCILYCPLEQQVNRGEQRYLEIQHLKKMSHSELSSQILEY